MLSVLLIPIKTVSKLHLRILESDAVSFANSLNETIDKLNLLGTMLF